MCAIKAFYVLCAAVGVAESDAAAANQTPGRLFTLSLRFLLVDVLRHTR